MKDTMLTYDTFQNINRTALQLLKDLPLIRSKEQDEIAIGLLQGAILKGFEMGQKFEKEEINKFQPKLHVDKFGIPK